MNPNETAQCYWKTTAHYPSYPHLHTRRLADVNFIVSKLSSQKSILDLGCGDGSMLIALREFTDLSSFYAYDLSEQLLTFLRRRWGDDLRLKTCSTDFSTITQLPITDVTLALGSFPYIFSDNELLGLLSKITSPLLIVRTPCTLQENAEIINTFSENLNAQYAAIYRTVEHYTMLLSHYFLITEVTRAYDDSIESPFGTKHYFFTCKRKSNAQ
jgi:trans-aconitate methyltransferase